MSRRAEPPTDYRDDASWTIPSALRRSHSRHRCSWAAGERRHGVVEPGLGRRPPVALMNVREPLFHFVLLAAALFALSALFGPGSDVIEVSREEIKWRILQIEASEGTRLTDEERRQVEERYLDELVLVREAQALGLAADERIDEILIQKMLHVLSGDVIQPSDDELAAYYAENLERYERSPTVTVDELVVIEGEPLPPALEEGAEPEELPAGSIVGHRVMARLELRELGLLFGAGGADLIFEADEGAWVDAYRSVRGQHWFRIRERFAAETPPLVDVRDFVRMDWIAENEDERLSNRVAELRARYTVVVEAAPGQP